MRTTIFESQTMARALGVVRPRRIYAKPAPRITQALQMDRGSVNVAPDAIGDFCTRTRLRNTPAQRSSRL